MNTTNPQYPELEDFGECSLRGNNGTSGYWRVDWLTPDGLGTWGVGCFIILGLEGAENAMTQTHTFQAAELCLKAQYDAVGYLAPQVGATGSQAIARR